jgi:hypothetical protein
MIESFLNPPSRGPIKKTQGTISRTIKILKQNYKRSIDLPLPPSRFVVVPTRIIREHRKAEKKTNKGVKGPKYRIVNKALH